MIAKELLGNPHVIDGEFQSDKYPTCPRGKVPLSTKDPMAKDLLRIYAKRRRLVDAQFADALEFVLGLEAVDQCTINRRTPEGFLRCPDPATHIVFMPFGTRWVCADHAEQHAKEAGFLVRRADEVCLDCGAIRPSRALIRCWCGSADGAELVKVDGLWFTLCAIHRPPKLNDLWWRLIKRIGNVIGGIFNHRHRLTTIETRLTSRRSTPAANRLPHE